LPAAIVALRLAASRISGLLSGANTLDLLAITAATLLMISAALIAGYLPARRASRVDPMVVLRNE